MPSTPFFQRYRPGAARDVVIVPDEASIFQTIMIIK